MLSRWLLSMGPMPHDEASMPDRRRAEARWVSRYRDAVDWAIRLQDALRGCREALREAGSDYEPSAGWDGLLTLPAFGDESEPLRARHSAAGEHPSPPDAGQGS